MNEYPRLQELELYEQARAENWAASTELYRLLLDNDSWGPDILQAPRLVEIEYSTYQAIPPTLNSWGELEHRDSLYHRYRRRSRMKSAR